MCIATHTTHKKSTHLGATNSINLNPFNMNIFKQLREVQSELKAPKSQYNSFGKYKYRNAEDILEAVKPLLSKHGLTLTLSDDINIIGDRYYVRAEVVVSNDDGEMIPVVAYAREEENKKGMDGSQVTGASSSYARKYALNGMFCIDDTKDSDSTNTHDDKAPAKSQSKAPAKKASDSGEEASIMDKAIAYMKSQNDRNKAYETVMKHYGDQLTDNQKAAIKKFVR